MTKLKNMLVMILALAIIAVPALVLTGCGSASVPSTSNLANQERDHLVSEFRDQFENVTNPGVLRNYLQDEAEELVRQLYDMEEITRVVRDERLDAIEAAFAGATTIDAIWTVFENSIGESLTQIFAARGTWSNGTYRFDISNSVRNTLGMMADLIIEELSDFSGAELREELIYLFTEDMLFLQWDLYTYAYIEFDAESLIEAFEAALGTLTDTTAIHNAVRSFMTTEMYPVMMNLANESLAAMDLPTLNQIPFPTLRVEGNRMTVNVNVRWFRDNLGDLIFGVDYGYEDEYENIWLDWIMGMNNLSISLDFRMDAQGNLVFIAPNMPSNIMNATMNQMVAYELYHALSEGLVTVRFQSGAFYVAIDMMEEVWAEGGGNRPVFQDPGNPPGVPGDFDWREEFTHLNEMMSFEAPAEWGWDGDDYWDFDNWVHQNWHYLNHFFGGQEGSNNPGGDTIVSSPAQVWSAIEFRFAR